MKFRISLLLILVTTGLIIALINFMLSDSGNNKPSSQVAVLGQETQVIEKVTKKEPMPKQMPPLASKDEEEDLDVDDDDDDEEDADEEVQVAEAKTPEVPTEKEPSGGDLSEKDIETIKKIANLEDEELAQEIEVLSAKISKENILPQLESGKLSGEKKAEAKKLLENFALLGLEKTRRRFMNIEPELKDPVFAHRKSLQEIRELLSDDE